MVLQRVKMDKAGIDSYSKLIDRKSGDNTPTVEKIL